MKGIKRLADHLQLSIGTVSRALNGRPDVREDTRKRVLEAAERLGYHPNQSGRALRTGATGVIGFVTKTGSRSASDGDTFFLSVFDGVHAVLARHKLDLVALLCGSEEEPLEFIQRVVGRGFVDGLIISSTQRRDPRISFLAQQQIPFVALGRSLTDCGHAWYDLDFESMVQTAVDRFVTRGHKRIGLGVPEDEINLGYVLSESFEAALATHGLRPDPAMIMPTPPDEAGGYALANRLLQLPQRPTAMLLENQPNSIGFYRGLTEAGVRPGRDIAIIGRDSPQSRFLSPTLTGFRIPLRELGVALAESLLATMPAYRQVYTQGIVRRLWPMTLIEGESDAIALNPPKSSLASAR